jgi:hypothetical protein
MQSISGSVIREGHEAGACGRVGARLGARMQMEGKRWSGPKGSGGGRDVYRLQQNEAEVKNTSNLTSL